MTPHPEAECIFCKIVRNELPATKIYEDAETMAFLNIKPIHPGHALVIPKDHFENIYTVPAETWARMNLTAQKVALAIREAVNADGMNVSTNNEPAAGQEIFHSHIHIIPRHNDDGLNHWEGKLIAPEESMKLKESITAVLEA